MPRYRVTLDGKTYELTGDHPPTEDEARQAIGAHVSASEPPPSASAPAPAAEPAKPHGDLGRYGGYKMIGDAAMRLLKSAKEHPIETGALVGGAVAAPFTGGASVPAAVAAAGLGGAGGAGLGMLYNAIAGEEASPTTAGGVLTRMGTEGATQAAAELGGRAVQGGLKAVAGQAYRGALRPAASVRAKYPNVVERGLEDAIVVGPRSAPVKARNLAMASKAEGNAMREAAQAGGAGPIPRSELRGPLMEMARESKRAAKLTGVPDESAAIVQRARSLQPSYALDEGHEAARILNDRADAAFRAEQRSGVTRGVEANMDKALARAFSGGVKDRVPGLAETNQVTSTRMGLAKALQAAAERPGVLGNLMAGSTGVGTYALTGDADKAMAASLALKGLSSPRALSTVGIGLNKAAAMPVANTFRAALLAKLLGEEPDQ